MMEMKLTKAKHIILCRHKDYIGQNIGFDFDEFWVGAQEEKTGSGSKKWLGGFAGRPGLADDFKPTLIAATHNAKPRIIQDYLTALRALFRFLDGYEQWVEKQSSSTFAGKVESLQDINTHHLLLWKTPSPTGEWIQARSNIYHRVARLLRLAKFRLNLPHLIVPSHSRDSPIDTNDVPDETIGKVLVKVLAKEAISIYEHWDRSDVLAATGRNLCGVKRIPFMAFGGETGYTTIDIEGGVTEADLHATYRAKVAANNDLPVDRLTFMESFAYEPRTARPRWWPCYGASHPMAGAKVAFSDLLDGLYPTSEQAATLFLLFLSRTGWNIGTANRIDISDDEKWCKSYSEKFIWLLSFKDRSKEWQDTVSIINHRTGAYQIIKRIMNRTDRLRCAIELDPSLCDNATIAKRSPWLFQKTSQKNMVPAVLVEIEETSLRRTLRRVINTYNSAKTDADLIVPLTVKPSDFRDIFAAATLVHSDFSLFLTQLALGHKKASTTFTYLRRKAWRAESSQNKNDLFVVLMDQIETHRIVDSTLLRAKMDGVIVTEEMLARLESYRNSRTYVGMGCSDPTHPPTYIDPTNPRDGTTRCIQSHLCAGCPKGRVFNDSLPGLSQRCAELEWLQDSLPLEVFQDSSLADQLLVIRATLKQWSPTEVDFHLVQWAGKIKSGEHRPIRFSGEY
jgi:hypothetical protein